MIKPRRPPSTERTQALGRSEPKARGRPRSEAARRAILAAARALLDEVGPGAVTMEALASRAGVGKPTIYRWWPDRHAVLMEALMQAEPPSRAPARRSAIDMLRDQLRAIAARFSVPSGRHIASLIAASDQESELSKAFRNHFVLARRAEGRGLLLQAIEQGELHAEVDLELALDLLYGAIFFRLMLGHAALDATFVERLLAELLRGIGPRRSTRAAGKAKR
jgi:AcrR family transcriptional regulator